MSEAELWNSRTRRLLGGAAAEMLVKKHVLVLGLGGVGGYVAEFLARCGVGKLTLVDGDRVALSNLNRQLPALRSNVGEYKSDVLTRRFSDINPAGEFVSVPRFVKPEGVAELLDTAAFDAAADAIDDVPAKVAFLAECVRRKLPVASSMGAGNKLDPAQVRTSDIGKTCGCPLARAVRKRLREAGITRGVTAIFSAEVVETEGAFGTVSYMTAAFGVHCAAAVLRKLGALPRR
ncbi:MAG: ThiF family adenylyltransferase [Lentisphaeria bacterium]|nr:ThiF family adenylyltransferase [Lentisphaeria bacterium]